MRNKTEHVYAFKGKNETAHKRGKEIERERKQKRKEITFRKTAFQSKFNKDQRK